MVSCSWLKYSHWVSVYYLSQNYLAYKVHVLKISSTFLSFCHYPSWPGLNLLNSERLFWIWYFIWKLTALVFLKNTLKSYCWEGHRDLEQWLTIQTRCCWFQVSNRCNVISYRNLVEDLEISLGIYLHQWIGRLQLSAHMCSAFRKYSQPLTYSKYFVLQPEFKMDLHTIPNNDKVKTCLQKCRNISFT